MAADQLSKKNPDGTLLGQSATDKVGFYGKTARVQMTFITSISAAQTTAVVKARINLIISRLINSGLMAAS
jgi:hypothetical protein